MSKTTDNKRKLVKFAPKGTDNFYDEIKQEAEKYFRDNDISQYANSVMRMKTIMMLSLYFVPYVFIVCGWVSGTPWLFYSLWFIMGIGVVGIGTGIMHDGNHGAYSKGKKVNFAFGGLLNLIGGYSRNWRIQHNVLHHTYTNLDGLDDDIATTMFIRMSPHKKHLAIHRYQHVYAWFLYCLMHLSWVVYKDFKQIFQYNREGLLKKEKVSLRRAFIEVILLKLFYVFNIIILPVLFSGMSFYQVMIGFTIMCVVSGLSLACIFQPAHVMETSSFPLPDDASKMEDSWARHQVLNTTNFAPDSRIVAWFIGGLNYQIEHHLFPHICHIHYPRLSPMVRRIAEKHDLPYHVQPTFMKAIAQHGHMLYLLGKR